MEKIKNISKRMLFFCNISLILIPFFTLISWVFIDTDWVKNLINQGLLFPPLQTPTGCANFANIDWVSTTKTLGLISSLVASIPPVLGLLAVKRVLARYVAGEIFSTYNAKQYNRLAWLFFGNALLVKPLSEALQIMAVTLSNPPGQRYISVSFGTPNIEALFVGVMVILISWVMLEASKIQDEQKLTV